MKFKFDPNQAFQLDAVSAVVDLFDGQPVQQPDYAVVFQTFDTPFFQGQERSPLGLGNALALDEDRLRQNARRIQDRNDIEVNNPADPLQGWPMSLPDGSSRPPCYHFSVEMETGTGKTYVYLRTIFELSQKYAFNKFIIVVPSVAVREGVLKSIEITAEHFKSLYNNMPFESFVYDAQKVNRLRQFAASNTLQIQIINIDAFRKNFTGTDEEKKSNVIYKESDKLSGRQPIEFIQTARPIVIIDEPQSVDSTEKAQEAIRALNPLCTLRYSATHRDPYNLVYRLDPVKAFELKLVKQIVVASAAAEGGANDAYVKVEKVDYKTGGIKAKLRIHVQGPDGPKEKPITVKNGADLYALSNERAQYQNGYSVTEIYAEPGNEYVRFSNGKTLKLGEETGGLRDDVWKAQIKHTIHRHLEKERQVEGRGIKVLSLFFVDSVSNYREYDSNGPIKGKFALAFEAMLAEYAKDERYKHLTGLKEALDRLHNGYFAMDKKGVYKDTRGDTQADDEVYNLIMKNKEQLLSTEEPLRFIFSHSALREGWDNPNVFQICTLNETRSVMKKRQELGRGLRLPVDQTGSRVFDESVNKLYVMANESYEDFAKALQKEYEEDCGVIFGKVPIQAIARLTRIQDDQPVAIGRETAEVLKASLVKQGLIDAEGRIQAAFEPTKAGFALDLPENYQDLAPALTDILSSYLIERHIHREQQEGPNRLKKEVVLSPEFKALWERIKPRTTYRVEFETETLVSRAVDALKRMPKIEKPKVRVSAGQMTVEKGGVTTTAFSVAEEVVTGYGPCLPDILAYLQNETELTRGTLVRILKASSRLSDVFIDAQRFMDAVSAALKYELHRLLVDGIKYEKLSAGQDDCEWEMLLFKNEELINYLDALKVNHSVYEYVVYDSMVERKFAETLDSREDIKLFVKLPSWFEVDTPLGKYNPDWAVVKHQDKALYLVKETKGTKDFLKLRTSEADKVRCGLKHFEALGVPFAVAVTADEV